MLLPGVSERRKSAKLVLAYPVADLHLMLLLLREDDTPSPFQYWLTGTQ